jgi:hypothetical protein
MYSPSGIRWMRRSAILLTRSGIFKTHTGNSRSGYSRLKHGGTTSRCLLWCRTKRATLGLTVIHSGIFFKKGAHTLGLAVFHSRREYIPQLDSEKTVKIWFLSTQKLYTSSILRYIYAILFFGLLINPCWYIMRVIYLRDFPNANIYS